MKQVAIGFLFVPLLMRVSRAFIDVAATVLVAEAPVGLWGFLLHTMGNLQGQALDSCLRQFHIWSPRNYGAPAMAPLLFPNLMMLGIIGRGSCEIGKTRSSC